MTPLDTAVDRLQGLLEQMQAATAADVDILWRMAVNALRGPIDKDALIAELQTILPDVVAAHAGAIADLSAAWYEELVPAASFEATVPDDLLPDERIAKSIAWAVNTATTSATALAQLQGTMQRAVLDAQRQTVSYNASREGVKYRRHCGYAACNWCLVMAGRGAVYRTAQNAVRGHDNCRCLAIPERSGMEAYTVPTLVRDAEKRYVAARKLLQDEGVDSPSLDAIIGRMDAIT